MRVAVLTSTSQRHMYFAAQIAKRFEIAIVLAEEKEFHPDQVHRDEAEKAVLSRWFDLRAEMERSFFDQEANQFRQTHSDRIVELGPKGINEPAGIARLVESGAEAAAVFGSSLLRKPVIDALEGQLVNCHLGLSPYYRGSGTNFWPFFNGEIQYVGVTIHWIDSGIDTGPILHQGRPEIRADDNPHSIGCKAIQVGAGLMCQVLSEVSEGRAVGRPQPPGEGRLYKRADFGAEHVRKVLADLDGGMIASYAKAPVDVEFIP